MEHQAARALIEGVAIKLIGLAAIRLPADVKGALERAYEEETSEVGKGQLRIILDNVDLAERTNRPICQDTGIVNFFTSIGDKFGFPSDIDRILEQALKKATEKIPLRPNVVHPISRKNTGTNVGVNVPRVSWRFARGDFLELTVLLKGAGCENMSALAMLSPSEGISAIKEFVMETVKRAGSQPCPPIVVGVGIGGTAAQASDLAEVALLRPLGISHRERAIEELEEELLSAINDTRIGPMGLGGRTTALGVQVEYAHTHTACLPVAVNISCWCLRRASARIHSDGTAAILK